MKKKNLTKKDIDQAINGLDKAMQIIWQKVVHNEQLFSLYLEHEGKAKSFDKFVKGKVEEFEKEQAKKDK